MSNIIKKIRIASETIERILDCMKGFEPTAVIEIKFGINASEQNFLNILTVMSASEKLQTTFQTEVPEDYEPEFDTLETPEGEQKIRKPYLQMLVKLKDFTNVVGSLATLNEDIYLSEDESGLARATVLGTASLQLDCLAGDTQVPSVTYDTKETVCQLAINAKSLLQTLRVGGSMAHRDEEESRGLSNIVFTYTCDKERVENGIVPGVISVYSSDGFAIAKGECVAAVAASSLEKLEGNKFQCALPRVHVRKLLSIIKEEKEVQMRVSQRHVCLAIGKNLVYTFTQGSKVTPVVFMADKWSAAEREFQLVLDQEEFTSSLEILNKMVNFKGIQKMPIKLTAQPVNRTLVMEIAGERNLGVVSVPIVDMKLPGQLVLFLSGMKVAECCSVLKKGNLSLSGHLLEEPVKQPVLFANGDLSGIGKNLVYLTPARELKQVSEQEEG